MTPYLANRFDIVVVVDIATDDNFYCSENTSFTDNQ